MSYPESEDIQGCASTYDGTMGGAGFVREQVCGETPDVRVPADQGQYYEDPNHPGNYHLFGFGFITGLTPKFNPNQKKTRGIGSKDIRCNKHSRYDTSLEISYNPVDLVRIPFITGIDDDISTLRQAVCVNDCLPYSSIETWHERDCPEEKEVRKLHNMGLTTDFKCSVQIGEYVEWTESIMHQFQQASDSKLYTPPLQSVEVGLNPLDPCCDAFMAYEGDVYKTKRENENLTSQIHVGGSTIFLLTYNVMDFNRDGNIDGLLGSFQNMQCFRDIEVYVDGILSNDTNLITVSPVNSKYFQLAAAVMPGQTITAKYYHMVQLFNITAYDFEKNNNGKESRGIWKGTPVPYEIQGVSRDYSGSLTANYKDDNEYEQMKDDEYFHLFFEQGGLSPTPIVWQLLFSKWESVDAPHNEDDLIALPLPFTSSKMCIDNQIRLPPDGSTEEGE